MPTLFFFIVAAYLFPIRFEANDDVTMLLIASGKYSGTPDAHLVFINYVYGLFLKLLYTWDQQIEWYSVLFAVFHIVCISVIAWFVLVKSKCRLLFKVLFLGVFYSLELRSIMLFQFTTTSALCAVSGLILITEGKRYQKYFGVLLFVLAALIRLEVAVLILFIMSPVFLRNIYDNGKIIFSKSLGLLLVALFIVSLMKFIDYRSYQNDKDWSYYEKYNKARGKINDNPYLWKTKMPASISSYDYSLLGQFFPDGHILTYDKLIIIKERLEQVDFKSKLSNTLLSLKDFKLIFIIVLATSVLFLLYNKERKGRFIIFLSIGLFLFSFFYISSFGSLKSRVFHSTLLGLFAAMVITFQDNKITNRYIERSLILSLSLFIFLFFRQTFIYQNLDINNRKSKFSQQKELMNKFLQNPDNSIVPFLADYLIEFYSPFAEINFKPGQMLISGWMTNNPLNQSKFDSYLDLIDRHSIFFKKTSFLKILPLLKESILMNYGIYVKPEVEMESEDYIIIKLKRI